MNNNQFPNNGFLNSDFQNMNNGSLTNQYQDIDFNQTGFEKEKKPFPIKLILLILLGIIVIGIIVFLIIHFVTKDKPGDYEDMLVAATQEYYNIYQDELPDVHGKCHTITLNDLYLNNLINNDVKTKLEKKNCNNDDTIIKVCRLESGNFHYNVSLSCDKSLSVNYGDWQIGSEGNLVTNRSDVRFSFLVQQAEIPIDIENIPNEEYFEDEIPYEAGTYTTVGEQTLYRYRDKTYKWYTENIYYYPNDETNKNKVNQYYLKAPNSTYNNKGESATVYRWYIGANELYNNGEYVSEAPEIYSVRGKQGTSVTYASTDKPEQKSYRTIKNAYIYRTRKVQSTDELVSVDYYCKNEDTGHKWVNAGTPWVSSGNPCNDEASGEVGTYKIDGYMCYWINDKTGKKTKSQTWRDTPCEDKYYYVNESVNEGYTTKWQADDCGYNANAKPYICDRRMGYVYTDQVWQWSTPSYKVYLPNNNDKITYYKLSPTAKAIKDMKTETTGYKWYKIVTNILGYYKTQPQSDAKKLAGSDSWTVWSEYQLTKEVESATRQVEERKKLTIKRTASDDTNWINVTDGYVSEAEAIAKVKELGYEVETLKDILELPNINYTLRLEYRNQTK